MSILKPRDHDEWMFIRAKCFGILGSNLYLKEFDNFTKKRPNRDMYAFYRYIVKFTMKKICEVGGDE